MTALTEWICRTPARLAAVALTAVAVLLGGGLLLGQRDAPAPLRPAQPAAPPVTEESATTTANAFVQSWCELAGRTPERWAADLQARSTPDLAEQWAPGMASTLTGDCPWLLSDVRWISPTGALVAVRPRSTNTLLVTVTQEGGRLAVADFGPEGAGDL